MIDKIVPPLRGKDAPRLLITKYGALSEDSSLPEHLDQEFVNWIKKYRTNYPTVSLPETRDALILFWKKKISEEYVKHAFDLSDKLP